MACTFSLRWLRFETMNEEANRIIDAAGGTTAVARRFELTTGAVSQWRDNGIPKPWMRVFKAEMPEIFQEPPPPSRPRPLPTLNGQGANPTAEPATTAVSAGSEHTEQEAASCRG